MANEIRVRSNFQAGTITDNPLTNVATTINSAAFASLPAIGATQHLPIVLDPLASAGAPEIVWITAHTASATSATVVRAQEGTAARQHASGTVWRHAPTIFDYDYIATSSTRPSTPYYGQTVFETDTNTFTARSTGGAWVPLAPLAWTAYTPTLTQSAAVTKTVTYAKYAQSGKTVVVNVALSATGAGTASNIVTVSLPVTAASSAGGNLVAGSFYLADVSAGAAGNFIGAAFLNTTTTAAGLITAGSNFLGASNFTAALAAGDLVSLVLAYEAA